MPREMPVNVFETHNHRACRKSAMDEARSLCDHENLRLTPGRARVLEILLESHQALGAYDILERLRAEGHPSQPPIVYRALEFLVAHGFVHRLERLNAFAACTHNDHAHDPMFLICDACQQVAEAPLDRVATAIDRRAAELGFQAVSHVVEVSGLCPACRQGGAP